MYSDDVGSKDKDELLKLSIEVEQEGIDLYKGMLEETSGMSVLTEFLEYMVEQEKSHKKSLQIVLRALQNRDREEVRRIVSEVEETDHKTPVFRDEGKITLENVNSVLNSAMEFEKNGVKLYREIAEKVGDKDLKKFFSDLKEQEKLHIEKIREFGVEKLDVKI